MLSYLILSFILIPLVELAVLIKVSQYIGFGSTLFIVIFTGVTGAYLARSQGIATLKKIQQDINNGVMPTDKLFDGALILCGGISLLTPGFITDALGFMTLIPFTRHLIKGWIKRKIEDIISEGKVISVHSRHLD